MAEYSSDSPHVVGMAEYSSSDSQQLEAERPTRKRRRTQDLGIIMIILHTCIILYRLT